MLPSHRPARALLLGLGAGTIARLLHARFGPLPIVAVDDDPRVVALARDELADLSDLEIVEADAFEYVQRSADRFELACVDLYRGAQLQSGIVARPFLRSLRALLSPRGLAVFNLVADRRVETRITRIGRVFRVLARAREGKNLVLWCR